MKRSILYSVLAASALLVTTSCDKDGELIYTEGPDKAEIVTSASYIELSKDRLEALALTLYWNDNGNISLDNPQIAPPDGAVSNVVEFGSDETFNVMYEEAVPIGVYERQYSVLQLNNITGRLGFEGGTEHTLYIRVRSSIGLNVTPVYSDVLSLTVVPFSIDWTTGFYLDKDQNNTGITLRSPLADGVFYAFLSVGAWENWYFSDPTNTVWGNPAEDGKVFHATTGNKWNFWFPGLSGSYYVTVNTNEGWWSALHIDNLTVAGDINGEMVYNQKANQWTLPVNMPAASTVSITVTGGGSLYNRETTDAGPAIQQTVAFGGDCQNLDFGETGTSISVNLPAGETTLILDLSNPMEWTIGAGEVATEPEAEPYLYFSGLVNWDGFDDYLTLTDEDALTYGGAHWIDSQYGYRVYTEPDWAKAYKSGDNSDALVGTLVPADSEGNIPAPEKGVYVMNYNMRTLTYSLTKVESITCVGLGDDWNEKELSPDVENPEIFRYEYVKTAATPWGVKILFNHDWNLFLGGGSQEGTAYLRTDGNAKGFSGDDVFEIGDTVILTVDLGKQTYTYALK